ncbi:MAG: carbonic anhydrase, partial [Flavobacteriaceae bacterium]|nr:carbonic anhydrase [Flavobacteriaceae bacterium]
MKIETILKNNQDWVTRKLNLDNDYFTNLSKGQSPKVLYIGCSDSRVCAEEMMGAGPGDIFVHRNVANLVPTDDINVGSVVEYAVAHLKVEHVIVCGHYGCGGVLAALNNEDLGVMNPWLKYIHNVYNKYQNELEMIEDHDQKYRRLVELNTLVQVENLRSVCSVQAAIADRSLQLHSW